MKKLSYLIAASALLFAACDDPTTTTNPEGVALTGVGFDKPTLNLMVGDEATLEVVFTPADATNKNITWENEDDNVATVDENGLVSAVAEGQTTITITSEDGGYTATCVVTVEAAAVDATLEVEAEGTIEITDNAFTFEGVGGELILNVTTNQPEWNYTLDPAEGWLTATKAGNALTLTAAGNYLPTTVEDVTLTFTAGDATAVTITLKQEMGAPEMVFVEGGTFAMGSPLTEGAPSLELPVRQVTLSNFRIGKFEVTQALWKAVLGEDKNTSVNHGDDLPVEKMMYKEVEEFLTTLNGMTGKNYRLPTEAEWEYAARGGKNKDAYTYSGSNNLDDVAWYQSNSEGKTHPVGGKAPNSLGIYDMTGNVSEYTSDWYATSYLPEDTNNPQGPPMPPMVSNQRKVTRGGSFGVDGTITSGISNQLTNTGRANNWATDYDSGYNYTGFRIVLPAE
jgi:formylglycine-generating enzyme required for sulfatase activity